jgi:hypothetical protein
MLPVILYENTLKKIENVVCQIFIFRNVNVIKFNKSLLIKLCIFIKVINKGVCDPG